ncbi:MAG TPA: SGNH/GDSL hydrolase family protein [Pirellulales bacterium]|nr:SGNH/GDSL hydrolase family protein [Pirellulales bacterium]
MRITTGCFVLIVAFAATLRAGVLTGDGIGVYGDSMSMQYSFWLPLAPEFNYSIFYNGTQFNWVDLLAQNGYNFGPPASVLGQTLLTYDAAVAGEKSTDLSGQVGNLQANITAGNIKLVVEMIGANDFNGSPYTTIYNNAANHSYNPLNDPTEIAYVSSIMANITASVNATLAENPNTHMILATVPDLGLTPQYRSHYPNATQRAAVSLVIQSLNQQILALAKEHHFPVIDMYAVAQSSLTSSIVGGVTMTDTGGTGGTNEFLSDGFHPGTVIQGLMANAILMADNLAYHDPVTYLTDQYILTQAGVSHTNTTSYFDVSPYVIAPEPSACALLGLGLASLIAAAHRSRAIRKSL